VEIQLQDKNEEDSFSLSSLEILNAINTKKF
jgi:hypothetical protein